MDDEEEEREEEEVERSGCPETEFVCYVTGVATCRHAWKAASSGGVFPHTAECSGGFSTFSVLPCGRSEYVSTAKKKQRGKGRVRARERLIVYLLLLSTP